MTEPSSSTPSPVISLVLRLLTFISILISLIILTNNSATIVVNSTELKLRFKDVYAYRWVTCMVGFSRWNSGFFRLFFGTLIYGFQIYAFCACRRTSIHPLANCVRDLSCEHGKTHIVQWWKSSSIRLLRWQGTTFIFFFASLLSLLKFLR